MSIASLAAGPVAGSMGELALPGWAGLFDDGTNLHWQKISTLDSGAL